MDVVSNAKIGRLSIPVNKLSFLAKGYVLPAPIATTPGSATMTPLPNAAPKGVQVQMNTSQSASQIALLYPAPCVVMAVPYNTSRDRE